MKSTGADFTFINWHTVFGNSTVRKAEIREMANLFRAVQDSDPTDQDVILLGDHNKDATSSYWTDLKGIRPAVSHKVNSKTSINRSCAYTSPYDHFWMQSSYVTEYSSSGMDYISNMCDFRNGLSDHAPIWLKLYSSYDSD